jgi:chromosome segregation ATPase
VVSQIRALRDEITLLRKERVKHIRLAEKLNVDLKDMEDRIKDTDDKIDGLKQTNDFIKTEILEFRNRTITDIKDFKTSYNSLTQNYFTERKYFDGQLRKSRDREANDIQTNALPILKERLRKLIHKNREKMKIVTDFKKACNQVNRMFAIMRDYKGKDDVDFIAREFVEK